MKFKWFVGIDISKSTLDTTLFNKESKGKSVHKKVSNCNIGFTELLKWLQNKVDSVEDILFCMEHTGVYGLDLSVFLESNKLYYSMVSPLHIKRSLGLTRGKNDKVDSYQISRFCYLHREELPLSKLPSKSIMELRGLLKERDRLVKMQVSEKIVLKELKNSIAISTKLRVEARLELIMKDIAIIEKEMEQIINTDEMMKKNYVLMKSIVGIALINSVYFIVYSMNFQSFTDARKFACYCGVAPFENSSGTSIHGKTRVSILANKKIKTCLSNGARSAVQNDPELKLYYVRKEKEGKEHGVIMNAVKFKLITRVFAVVNRGTPYVKLRQAG